MSATPSSRSALGTDARVGLGFRPRLAAALFADPSAVDFVEVVAEACREPRSRREACALSEVWPVVPHGVKLSLGSAEGIDDARAAELARIARDVRAPVVSEHVAFVRASGREIGHLTELPHTREAVRVVARNVARLRRVLPDVPLLLENVARAFVWREREAAEMSEGDFYAEIVRATGCELLLDVGNLFANAKNAGLDARALLATYPLEDVAMIHVAGSVVEHGFTFDTHAHAVPEEVFDLAQRALDAAPGAPVLLERDGDLGATEAIFAELARLREIASTPTERPARRAAPARPTEERDEDEDGGTLAREQAALAESLTSTTPTADTAIARARGVLVRKRADDALPLLPELGQRVMPEDAFALGRIEQVPRLATMTAVADAMRIARAARDLPHLRAAAARDALVLRARFSGGPDRPRPRALPFVGREGIDGRVVWAWKGFGRGAAVRMVAGGVRDDERGASE